MNDREIMREATRAGITVESIGEWANFMRRYERLGKMKEARECALKILDIHFVWGNRLDCYKARDFMIKRCEDILKG